MKTTQYDVIVFGASSFVGQILCGYLAKQFGIGGELRWAIAGRSRNKLESVRADLRPLLNELTDQLPILIADASDDAALTELCRQTRVVVSTVGPYALYGEPLVKACVAQGTDYCDLTGEAQWIKRMVDRYQAQAEQSGARIVHCCGFDSVPSDMGVWFLQQQANDLHQQAVHDIKMRVKAAKGTFSGGTVASIINVMKEALQNPALRKELANPYSICPADHGFKQRQRNLKGAAFDDDFGSWSAPFVMAAINTRVVHRSNALQHKRYGVDFQYDETMLTGKGVTGRLAAYGVVAALGGFLIATALKPTRWILEKYILPKPGEGPSKDAQKNGYYDIRFLGTLANGQQIRVKVTGDQDPGYGSTAKMLGQAAASLALDYHHDDTKCDKEGGIWTPASIFDQRYIDRLTKFAGLTFEHINQ